MNTREQIAPLNEGTLDLGLLRNTPLPDTLNFAVIRHEPLMALVPRAHALAKKRELRWLNWLKNPLFFLIRR